MYDIITRTCYYDTVYGNLLFTACLYYKDTLMHGNLLFMTCLYYTTVMSPRLVS